MQVVSQINPLQKLLTFSIRKKFSRQSYSIRQKITESQVNKFAEISGDRNPLHIDKQYAQKSIFKQRIAHGMLAMVYFDRLIKKGKWNLQSMEIRFLKPIFLDQQILVQLQINYVSEKIAKQIKDGSRVQGEFQLKIYKFQEQNLQTANTQRLVLTTLSKGNISKTLQQ